jgi:hypothetical protein
MGVRTPFQVVKLKPTDKDAQLKLKECERVVKALRFASAIASPDESLENVSESIDLSDMGARARARACSCSRKPSHACGFSPVSCADSPLRPLHSGGAVVRGRAAG